jgi:hypothetical protein
MLRKRLTVDKINEKLKKIADPVKRFEKLLEVLKFLFVVFNKNKIDKQRCVYELLFVKNSDFVLEIKKDEISK